jgi:hypothetical protein
MLRQPRHEIKFNSSPLPEKRHALSMPKTPTELAKRKSTWPSATIAWLVTIVMITGTESRAQETLETALKTQLSGQESATQQHRSFVRSRIKSLEMAASADEWQQKANELRQRVLSDVVFRGVPDDWRSATLKIIWHGVIETKHGYRIRKLRFEALPDLWIPALLYEPDKLDGKVPAILNVNGHAATGKSTDYKQLRCINLAKRGMLALNLEWIGMGQLKNPGLGHNQLCKMDLCGRSGLSVFYLAMQRGLDVLLAHGHADLKRTAVTGLSGGGWQTILLSSLDTRVKLCVPVAGHSAIVQRLIHPGSIGDLEQIPNDLAATAGYLHLNALMAPRPMLMIYNAADNCCFVAKSAKPTTFDPTVPFYQQAGVEERLAYYENTEPGTHNYDQDNREQLYHFLNLHFRPTERIAAEIPSNDEIRSHEELNVPLPDDTADFNSLANAAARNLPRPLPKSPNEQRELLKKILRYTEPDIGEPQLTGPKPIEKFQVRQLRLQIDDWQISATVVETDDIRRHVVLIADGGIVSQHQRIAELVNDGARVLALDPILVGHNKPTVGQLYQNAMLLATVGERPLGVQAGQVLSASRQFAHIFGVNSVVIDATGPRCALVARCAAALDTGRTIDSVEAIGEAKSLKDFLKPEASYNTTPEIYCFGLLEYFDIPQLTNLPPKQERLSAERVQRLKQLGATVFTRGDDVIEVSANRTKIADKDLLLVSEFTRLTDLSLKGTTVSDKGLVHLRNLSKLEWLNLYRTRVGDQGLKEIGRLKSIQHLPIGETRVTDAGLAHLRDMKQLVYLGLRGNDVTDDGVKHVRQLKLTGLHLGETKVTDAGLVHLLGMAGLQRLWLDKTTVSDKSIATLAMLKSLRELHIPRTQITTAGVKRLAALLPRCHIEDE